MLSKNKIRLIKSLDSKKAREETHLFIAEGGKSVIDLIKAFDCELLVATGEWLTEHGHLLNGCKEVIEAPHDDIRRASLLKNPQDVLAIFRQDDMQAAPQEVGRQLAIYLDNVQDPGNLGTILRLADWFGISHVACSPGCADIYNPKTVQATMGSLARVRVCTVAADDFFPPLSGKTPVYGTYMDGDNIYDRELSEHGIIIMGNEGNGISPTTARYVTDRIAIPSMPHGDSHPESLNVAIATAITCSEFLRYRLAGHTGAMMRHTDKK